MDVTLITIGHFIIVPIQVELDDIAAKRLQDNILQKIESSSATGLLIDVSALQIIDSFLGRVLIETYKMAQLMGAQTVLTGLRKEVVLTLLHLGLTMNQLKTALNIEDGMAKLNGLTGEHYEIV